MELARVTSKGQITIPIAIRKRLGVKEGDKLLFIEHNGKIEILNSTMLAIQEAQQAFEGEAEKAGFSSEDDVTEFIKLLRKEKA